MDFYSFYEKKKKDKKKEEGEKMWAISFDIKTKCNVIVWWRVLLCI